MAIVHYTSEQLRLMQEQGLSKTDWQAIDNQPIQETPDDEFHFDTAVVVYPTSKAKTQISFRIDTELLAFLKQESEIKNARGYQSLMHAILESYKQQRQNNL